MCNAFNTELSNVEDPCNNLAIDVIFKIFTLTFRGKEKEAQR